MKKIYIIGAGDTGREVIDLIDRINLKDKRWELIGFIDENPNVIGTMVENYPVFGGIQYLNEINEEIYVVCAIGNGQVKARIISEITNSFVKYAVLVDPSVLICSNATIGEGTIIYAGTVLAINTNIGKHVYISFNCSIGHDSIVKDCCSVYPGSNISGKVIVMDSTVVGTGSKVIQGIKVGKNCLLGAGTVVIEDIPSNSKVVGVPARCI